MNMVCANPECVAELKYLRGGRLFLMERQPVVLQGDRTASAAKPSASMRRYFWLCEDCAAKYTIQRWTDAGIELSAKRPAASVHHLEPRNSSAWAVPGLVG